MIYFYINLQQRISMRTSMWNKYTVLEDTVLHMRPSSLGHADTRANKSEGSSTFLHFLRGNLEAKPPECGHTDLCFFCCKCGSQPLTVSPIYCSSSSQRQTTHVATYFRRRAGTAGSPLPDPVELSCSLCATAATSKRCFTV